MNNPLEVFSDLSENLHYNQFSLPIYVYSDTLSRYSFCASCHWHPDLEFIVILEGEMDFFVSNKIVHLTKGTGLFVNSCRLHYGFSSEKKECHFIAIVISQTLFPENVSPIRDYIRKTFGNETNDFVFLSSESDWQNRMLQNLKQLEQEKISNPLLLISETMKICGTIANHLHQKKNVLKNLKSKKSTYDMINFIHKNYRKKITLTDISRAGAVCRSSCYKIFQSDTGKTPNTYLTEFRISVACKLLVETRQSLLEIAQNSGFQTSSYFSYVFKKFVKLSPREYRDKYKL